MTKKNTMTVLLYASARVKNQMIKTKNFKFHYQMERSTNKKYARTIAMR